MLECYREQNLRRALQLNDQAPWLTNLVSRGGILKKNAADLLNAVTYLMYQGGHKGPKIKENVELICKNTDNHSTIHKFCKADTVQIDAIVQYTLN